MIHYLVTGRADSTLRRFLDEWRPPIADRIRALHYEDLHRRRHAEPGLYIFSDIERLLPAQRRLAVACHRRLNAAGPSFRTLNDPAAVLTRFEVLDLLHRTGVNPHRAHRPDADLSRCRFPVFLRLENTHDGAMTPLLRNHDELRAALRDTMGSLGRGQRRRLIVVEFCDTAADGVFRKIGAMRIGEALFARHVLVSGSWMLKFADRVTPESVAAERDYIATFPHRDAIAAIFEATRIEFGRLDYSIRDGRPVVWEINTNPQFVPHRHDLHPDRVPIQEAGAARVCEALTNLHDRLPPGRSVKLFGWSDVAMTLPAWLASRRYHRWVKKAGAKGVGVAAPAAAH